MRVSPGWSLFTCLVATFVVAALAAKQLPHTLSLDEQTRGRGRTVVGDLCSSALPLARGATARVDLCQAWNDYDPGAASCSPCTLPGPEVVFEIDTQMGEQVRIAVSILSGNPDVRLYLASECEDPASSCLMATTSQAATAELTMASSGTCYLFVDTTEGCGEVEVLREEIAFTAATNWGALKAIYR